MSDNKAIKTMSAEEGFNFSNLKILNDTVIAKPFVRHEEIGGIILPTTQQEMNCKSVVECVGPGNLINAKKTHFCPGCPDCKADQDRGRHPMRVKPGDIIFHTQFAGSETKIERKKYLVMHETDIWGIYTGERPIDISPFDDRVIIEWEEGQKEYHDTRIVRAQVGMDRHYTGIVIAIGTEVKDLKIGNRVFFDQFCGPERIDFEGKRYAFLYEGDCYCVIPKRVEFEVLSQ